MYGISWWFFFCRIACLIFKNASHKLLIWSQKVMNSNAQQMKSRVLLLATNWTRLTSAYLSWTLKLKRIRPALWLVWTLHLALIFTVLFWCIYIHRMIFFCHKSKTNLTMLFWLDLHTTIFCRRILSVTGIRMRRRLLLWGRPSSPLRQNSLPTRNSLWLKQPLRAYTKLRLESLLKGVPSEYYNNVYIKLFSTVH